MSRGHRADCKSEPLETTTFCEWVEGIRTFVCLTCGDGWESADNEPENET
jgi:hypothetical protein